MHGDHGRGHRIGGGSWRTTVDSPGSPTAGARYRMTIRFRRFRRFRRDIDTRTIGLSHIGFDRDGRIAVHQDFRNSTTGPFEHVPGLG